VPLLKSDHVVAPLVTVTTAGQPLTPASEEIAVARRQTASEVSIDKAPLLFVGYVSAGRGWDDFRAGRARQDPRGAGQRPRFRAKGDPLEGNFGGRR
jgi:hypothetical protein